MYQYKPDIVAMTRIPGHGFVHWSFVSKFVPPSLFLTTQTLLVPLICMKGDWTRQTTFLLILTFIVPAVTAISGRWIALSRFVHAPLAYLTLILLGYFGGIGSRLDWIILIGFNIWAGIYWAIMGAGLSDPLKRILEVLDRVKAGDLSARATLNFERRDELGRVTSGINAMLEEIERVFGSGYAESAAELSDVSARQAASVEEISSSLEEIHAMALQSNENAKQSRQIMHAADDMINQADKLMRDLKDAMKDIAASGGEIRTILKSIDEIAFQTNLLALNAAVEAARAGEAGAGFAVVADEVRNLAMRAAEASQNTAQRIEATVTKVKQGTDVVDKTGESFSMVLENTRKISDVINRISEASDEQVKGIGEISSAMAEINTLTQQNASIAERLANLMRTRHDHDEDNLLPARVAQPKRIPARQIK